MLVGDDIFIRGVRKGVEAGEYVYRRGELLYGQGDPSAAIEISEQAIIFTTAYAKEHGIWPRQHRSAAAGTGTDDAGTVKPRHRRHRRRRHRRPVRSPPKGC